MKNIKMLVMDVDGTLTDGKIYQGENGELLKAFFARDGYGIKNILPTLNIIPAIITGLDTKIVSSRMENLDVKEVYQGIPSGKVDKLKEISLKYNIKLDEMLYIGDDVNDMDCMEAVGFCACPPNSHPAVLAFMKNRKNAYITKAAAGYGAVREIIDLIKDNM
ncbi:MAG: HAD hydrolase family protein [Sphaerochaetaceae bacterium]